MDTTTTEAPTVRVEPVTAGAGARFGRRDWRITSPDDLTDEQAKAITWRATPEQVRMGAFVEVIDAGGTRIGELTGATFHRQPFGPSYVVCTITLT